MRNNTWIWTVGLVLSTGLAALFCEHSGLAQPLRALFALTTFVCISAVLVTGARRLAEHTPAELYCFTRIVSRGVYILVYVLAIVRFCVYLLDPGHAPSGLSTDDFQLYVICCITPLWLVRALVLENHRRNALRSAAAHYPTGHVTTSDLTGPFRGQ